MEIFRNTQLPQAIIQWLLCACENLISLLSACKAPFCTGFLNRSNYSCLGSNTALTELGLLCLLTPVSSLFFHLTSSRSGILLSLWLSNLTFLVRVHLPTWPRAHELSETQLSTQESVPELQWVLLLSAQQFQNGLGRPVLQTMPQSTSSSSAQTRGISIAVACPSAHQNLLLTEPSRSHAIQRE